MGRAARRPALQGDPRQGLAAAADAVGGRIANFVVVSDPDRERRAAAVARATARLAPVAGLTAGRLDIGTTTICWVSAADAPVDTLELPDGGALLLGDALVRGEERRATARELHAAWTGDAPPAYDGFFAGVAVREGGITVGGDLLGLFPLYVASSGDCFVAASTATAFDGHPLFDGPVDTTAVLGYLLTGGPFDGRTLRPAVRRLDAGVLLRWDARRGATETRVFAWPREGVDGASSFEALTERLDAAQATALRRHTAPHPQLALLLSGGRDSRTLAGYLARAGRTASALTLGQPTDHDATCAAAVARQLRMPHRLHDVDATRLPAYAARTVAHERLATGMSTVHSWAAADALAAGGAVLSGYVWEIRQIAALPDAREAMLQWTHAHALRPEALAALLRPALRPLVDEVMDAVRTRFDALASDAADGGEASFRWMMAGYARFHAGAVPWRLSFAAWPVLPIVDQDLLRTMCAIPREFLSARRMQDEILRTRFPALARLPLDRNADDLRPLLDSPWARARRALRGLADRTRPAGRATRSTVPLERRYYARMYDFDAPGWQAIRRAAEPGREALHEWFLPEALAALVPPAPQRAAHTDPIAQGFGPKMLVGLMQMLAPSGGAAA